MKLSVIIVTYNAEEFVPGCLDSLARDIGEMAHEVFVVDNSPKDNVADLLRRDYPDVALIKSGENFGFAVANNIAIRRSTGDYILFLNPDTVVRQNSVRSLIDFMEHHPDVGLVAGRLVNGDGSLQYSIRNFPTVANQLGECLFLYKVPFTPNSLVEMVRDRREYQSERPVDWVTGAQFLVRRSVVKQVGAFDERFFLYSEEQDWCYRIKKAGWKLYYTPAAEFVHYQGESSTNPNLYSQLLISKILFFKKHYGSAQASLLRAILMLNALIRFLGWSVFSVAALGRGGKRRDKALVHGIGLSQVLFGDERTAALRIKRRITGNT